MKKLPFFTLKLVVWLNNSWIDFRSMTTFVLLKNGIHTQHLFNLTDVLEMFIIPWLLDISRKTFLVFVYKGKSTVEPSILTVMQSMVEQLPFLFDVQINIKNKNLFNDLNNTLIRNKVLTYLKPLPVVLQNLSWVF